MSSVHLIFGTNDIIIGTQYLWLKKNIFLLFYKKLALNNVNNNYLHYLVLIIKCKPNYYIILNKIF